MNSINQNFNLGVEWNFEVCVLLIDNYKQICCEEHPV